MLLQLSQAFCWGADHEPPATGGRARVRRTRSPTPAARTQARLISARHCRLIVMMPVVGSTRVSVNSFRLSSSQVTPAVCTRSNGPG